MRYWALKRLAAILLKARRQAWVVLRKSLPAQSKNTRIEFYSFGTFALCAQTYVCSGVVTH